MLRLVVAVWLLTGSLSAAIWPNPTRLGIVVDNSSPVSRQPSTSLDASLADALSRYADFYLTANGYTVSLLNSSTDSTVDMRLFLSVAGNLDRRTSLHVDHRRRHRFVTTPDLLELDVRYTLSERRGSTWVDLADGRIIERADPQWVDHFGVAIPPALDSLFLHMPEPFEYVLQRSVEKIVRKLHFRTRRPQSDIVGTAATPFTLMVDPSYLAAHRDNWSRDAAAVTSVASRFYGDSFQSPLRSDQLMIDRFVPAPRTPIRDLYDLLDKRTGADDHLTFALYSYANPLEHMLGRDHDEIGLSVTGNGLILIRDFPVPKNLDSRWSALFTGLNLTHELGHRYGAVHVSDPRSVMNHTLSWYIPDDIDRLNAAIIRTALQSPSIWRDSVAYAVFVAQAIDSTGYSLADLPAIFYRLLPAETASAAPKSPLARVKPVYFLAAQAYGHLIHGELSTAADLFRKAIALAPDQAALHFYLANCTTGDESQSAWHTAARLGYWQAQIASGRPSHTQ